MGLLNLYVAYSFSTDTWVNFKLFGGIGLMLAVHGRAGRLPQPPHEARATRPARRQPPERRRMAVTAAGHRGRAARGAAAAGAARCSDDSHLHAGHAGAREGRHFSVRVVSARFNGLSRVARHRLVYDALRIADPAGHPRAGHRRPGARANADPHRRRQRTTAPRPRRLPTLKGPTHEERLLAARCALAAAPLPLAAQAQNIAIVNGKAVPKARVDALMHAGHPAGRPAAHARARAAGARRGRAARDLHAGSREARPGRHRPTTSRRWSWRARAS